MTSTVARLPALVPPPAELPPRAAALRAQVREFLAAERAAGAWAPRADVWLSGWDERFTKELARRGWLGMTIPVEYGGHGARLLDRYVVTEELLGAGRAGRGALGRRPPGRPRPAARTAPRSSGARFLPGDRRGRVLLRHRHERARLRLRPGRACARAPSRSTAGGCSPARKVWTSGAHRAHDFVVLARTEPARPAHRHAGFSQFIVRLRRPGVTIGPILLDERRTPLQRGHLRRRVRPRREVLGEIGDGWHQVTAELAFERSGPERILSTPRCCRRSSGELAPDRLSTTARPPRSASWWRG